MNGEALASLKHWRKSISAASKPTLDALFTQFPLSACQFMFEALLSGIEHTKTISENFEENSICSIFRETFPSTTLNDLKPNLWKSIFQYLDYNDQALNMTRINKSCPILVATNFQNYDKIVKRPVKFIRFCFTDKNDKHCSTKNRHNITITNEEHHIPAFRRYSKYIKNACFSNVDFSHSFFTKYKEKYKDWDQDEWLASLETLHVILDVTNAAKWMEYFHETNIMFAELRFFKISCLFDRILSRVSSQITLKDVPYQAIFPALRALTFDESMSEIQDAFIAKILPNVSEYSTFIVCQMRCFLNC